MSSRRKAPDCPPAKQPDKVSAEQALHRLVNALADDPAIGHHTRSAAEALLPHTAKLAGEKDVRPTSAAH